MEQVLVICHYLQEVLDIASYGPGQILSAFRHVGSPVPVDLRQTIRNMKSKKAWVNFTDLESLRTTTEGENFVTYSLPKSASVKKGK